MIFHECPARDGLRLQVAQWPGPDATGGGGQGSVLLVHGAGSHCGQLQVLAEALLRRGIATWGVDLRGHGRSEGERGVFTLAQLADDVCAAAAWVRARGGKSPVVLGTGMGGEVAFHALTAAADEVRGAVCHTVMFGHLGGWDARSRMLRGGPGRLLARTTPGRMIPLDHIGEAPILMLDPMLLKEHREDPLATRAYSISSMVDLVTARPARPVAANTRPVLLAWGERDLVIPVQHGLRCYMALGGPKEFQVVPGAAHQLAVEYPDELAGVTAGFLARLGS